MNQATLDETLAKMSREEYLSALFHNFVVQQTNMAFVFMGRMPHPQTGETMHDFEGAKFFIDQLEMVEVKTRGNREKQEDQLIKQSLEVLRAGFAEAMRKAALAPGEDSQSGPPTQSTAAGEQRKKVPNSD